VRGPRGPLFYPWACLEVLAVACPGTLSPRLAQLILLTVGANRNFNTYCRRLGMDADKNFSERRILINVHSRSTGITL
jgi:hypothetical protein